MARLYIMALSNVLFLLSRFGLELSQSRVITVPFQKGETPSCAGSKLIIEATLHEGQCFHGSVKLSPLPLLILGVGDVSSFSTNPAKTGICMIFRQR